MDRAACSAARSRRRTVTRLVPSTNATTSSVVGVRHRSALQTPSKIANGNLTKYLGERHDDPVVGFVGVSTDYSTWSFCSFQQNATSVAGGNTHLFPNLLYFVGVGGGSSPRSGNCQSTRVLVQTLQVCIFEVCGQMDPNYLRFDHEKGTSIQRNWKRPRKGASLHRRCIQHTTYGRSWYRRDIFAFYPKECAYAYDRMSAHCIHWNLQEVVRLTPQHRLLEAVEVDVNVGSDGLDRESLQLGGL